jgi:DNA polymerase-4
MDVCVENVFPAVAAPFNSFHDDARESNGDEAGASRVRATPPIVHVVVDEFFASVEQVLDPELNGKPVMVGRGVVVSASSEAKLCGVKPGMAIGDAMRICPSGAVIAGHYEQYADFAERVQRILETFAPKVEAGALDDFYLNFAGTKQSYPAYEATLRRVQAEVLEETGLSASVGAARTKAVASMASRREQPRGFQMVPPGTEADFLAPLRVEALSGLEDVHARVLAERGISTIGQLQRVPRPALQAAFGDALGGEIWYNARGMDKGETEKTVTREPVSVSRETAVEGGTTDAELLSGLIEYLSERIAAALRESERRARAIGLRIRYIDQFAASQTVRLTSASNDERDLSAEAKELLAQLFTRRIAVQTLGLSVMNLEPDQLQIDMPEQYPEITLGEAPCHFARTIASPVAAQSSHAALLERAAS